MKLFDSQTWRSIYRTSSVLVKTGQLVIAFLFCFSLNLSAQVQGTVIDEIGEPLIGVNILIKGTSTGTVTDFDGTYSLNADSDDVLVYSYTGYKDQEVLVGAQSRIDVTLASDTEILDEVVVVGYGVQKKSDLTGSVASLDGGEIAALVTGNPTSALQGKISGVQVENNGGQPGGNANVFVRGVSSLTNSFPLYVIDGTFADNMNMVNPKDIDRMEVLKDASAAAIYGSRAANGVVIISTKRGSEGAPKVLFDLRTGVESPSKLLDFLNGREFIDYRNQREANDGTGFTFPNISEDTDFQDLALNQGAIHDYGVSLSGGGENSSYYLSGNYFNQDGILHSSGFERYNFRANSDFTVGRFKVQQSFTAVQSEFEDNPWFGTNGSAPPPILRENVPENDGGFEAPSFDIHNFAGWNEYGLAELEENFTNTTAILGNLNFSYEIVDGLTAKINFGVDKRDVNVNVFRPTFFMSTSDANDNINDQNDLTNVDTETFLTLVEPTLSYGQDMGDSRLDVVVGLTQQKITTTSNGVYVQGLPNNDIRVIGAVGPSNVQNLLGFKNISTLRSAFGRVNYSLNNKYLFTATVRRDESSKFARDFRVGIFPSASVGWKVSNEPFWNNSTITSLKLRAGYGELGSQNIPDYSYQSVFNLTSGTSVNDQIVNGYAQTSLALEDLKWETAKTFNIGFDAGLWDDKFTLSAEYYNKDVEDVLVGVALPSSVGFSQPVIQNVGEINNKGIEVEGVYHGGNSNFKWDLGFNISTFNSTITSLPNPVVGPSVSEDLVRVNRFVEGEAPGVFYGFETIGVYADQAAIDSDPNTANDDARRAIIQPGDLIRRDLNGDGRITGDDQTILGDPTPDFIYGLNFSGVAGDLDFGLFFQGSQGNEIYNVTRYYNIFWADGNKLSEIKNAWTPSNTNTDIPRTTTSDAAQNGAPSSFFVEDGSYFRLRTAELGYTVDAGTIDWLSSVRIFVTGQNLFTLTNYSGYNPDISSVNGGRSTSSPFYGVPSQVNPLLGRGLDVRAYPNSRSFIFGVQLGF